MGTNLLRPPRPLRLIHKGRMKETAGWCRPLTAGTQTVHEFLLKRLADESSTQEDVSDHQAVAVRFDAHKFGGVRGELHPLHSTRFQARRRRLSDDPLQRLAFVALGLLPPRCTNITDRANQPMLPLVRGDDCDALYLLLAVFYEPGMIFKSRNILLAVESGSINQHPRYLLVA
jgi:hypothetical protein